MSGKLDALDELLAQIPTLKCPHCGSKSWFTYLLPVDNVYEVIDYSGTVINVNSDMANEVRHEDEAQLFCCADGCQQTFPIPEGFSVIWDWDNDEEEA